MDPAWLVLALLFKCNRCCVYGKLSPLLDQIQPTHFRYIITNEQRTLQSLFEQNLIGYIYSLSADSENEERKIILGLLTTINII